ncbi:MAG: S16 family serine protease [Ilumatobacteraceae bacterium]
MDNNHEYPALEHDTKKGSPAVTRCSLVTLVAAAIVLTIGTGPATVNRSADLAPCCEQAGVSGSEDSPPALVVAPSSDRDRSIAPDAVAQYVGGIAARIYTVDGSPVPGNVFVLMAIAGSDEHARLFDQTRYTHDQGIASDTLESNLTAVEVVEMITGADLHLLDFTTAPGGGPSGGLIYAISYLNIVSDGAFTGDVRVAATGQLGVQGYVHAINGIDEKTGAAHLADADVLFTPSTPSTDNIDAYGTRHVGELFRARNTGAPLAEERQLDHYRNWGTDRPVGMDIVGTRHIADVAAYLCGTGSKYACDILGLLADDIIGGATIANGDDAGDYVTTAQIR